MYRNELPADKHRRIRFMKWKYLLGWIPLVFIAIINGTIRQIFFQKPFGELNAHQLSTATGIVLFGLYIYWLMRCWRPESIKAAVQIGLVWVVLTVIFEFCMGRIILGRDWSVLLHDYNIAGGRVWILVLIWVAIAPSVFYWISGKNKSNGNM
jgi:hypothetical protein